ncbi:MAG: hypothetical protein IT311_11355 [Anaerolineales bacterium]|nr:hypothetical protein [Anaerolineales bacterium]MCZ2122153.1 hypothetical protein [Anaerolineales bacterium]
MFRRRPPRGGFRKIGRAEIPPLLKRANHLLNGGQFAEAGEAFEELAERAFARQGPRAPVFFLQAGRARVLNGQNEIGLAHFKRGLQLFINIGKPFRAHHAGQRIITELNRQGLASEAEQIQNFLATLLPNLPDGEAEDRPPLLPTHCPACGAALKPDEVEWLDSVTAECAYCGSPVRGA